MKSLKEKASNFLDKPVKTMKRNGKNRFIVILSDFTWYELYVKHGDNIVGLIGEFFGCEFLFYDLDDLLFAQNVVHKFDNDADMEHFLLNLDIKMIHFL